MKRCLIEYKKRKLKDFFLTPVDAVSLLLPFIPEGVRVIWECSDAGGQSGVSSGLREAGYEVIGTDIMTGFDFLSDIPRFSFDAIITNPPFSLKTKFLRKCYSYGKFFSLLLPLTSLEGIERNLLYRKYGINVIIPKRRIEYGSGKVWFASAWFFWLPNGQNNRIYFQS